MINLMCFYIVIQLTFDKKYINEFIEKGTAKISFLSQTVDNFLHFYKTNLNPSYFSVYDVSSVIVGFLYNPYKTIAQALKKADEKTDEDHHLTQTPPCQLPLEPTTFRWRTCACPPRGTDIKCR